MKFSCKEYSRGTTGLANFDLFDIPSVNVGDRIKIDAYPQEERVRTDRDLRSLPGSGYLLRIFRLNRDKTSVRKD